MGNMQGQNWFIPSIYYSNGLHVYSASLEGKELLFILTIQEMRSFISIHPNVNTLAEILQYCSRLSRSEEMKKLALFYLQMQLTEYIVQKFCESLHFPSGK